MTDKVHTYLPSDVSREWINGAVKGSIASSSATLLYFSGKLELINCRAFWNQ